MLLGAKTPLPRQNQIDAIVLFGMIFCELIHGHDCGHPPILF
jgi:hypothetical protein